MPQQNIDMIRDAEKKASEIRNLALDEAKTAIRKAEEEIAMFKEEQLKAIRQDAKKMIEAAAENAQSKAGEADARYEADRAAFRDEAYKNMGKAVGIVVERIIKR